VVPIRAPTAGDIGRAAPWFPVIGAVLGAAAGGVRYGLEPLIGVVPGTVVALICLVALTGALHQDGLADTLDGLGVRGDRERRLAAMRDSAVGVFGALAIIGWALLMLAALASLVDRDALAALIIAAALGRWAAVAHGSFTRPARPDGLGAAFVVSRLGLAVATAFSLAVVGLASVLAEGGLGFTTAPPETQTFSGGEINGFLNLMSVPTHDDLPERLAAGAVAFAAATIVTGVWSWFADRAFGGRTGDTLGAAVAVVEAVACLVLVGFWAP
jgi:adenosylcobinamide-GDP ribazoletransferase